MSCEHEAFSAGVSVARLTEVEGGAVIGFSAAISIRCNACGALFVFEGLPMGMSATMPTASVDRTELRVPISPPAEQRSS